MEQLIKDIHEIIKDYREDDGKMSEEIITTWISQFKEEDREFLLSEMKHILQKRYISESKAKELIKGMIEFLSKKYEYESPKEFLLKCTFIDSQSEKKSQSILLKFIDELIQSEYSISIQDCNSENSPYYLYFDDVMCTGDTFVKSMTKEEEGWFLNKNEEGKSNLEFFKENEGQLILAYFCIHKACISNLSNRIYHAINENVGFVYAWDKNFEIDNDVNKDDSKLNFIFPKTNGEKHLSECQSQIEKKIKDRGYQLNDTIKYRDDNKPVEENFFSSPENRDRFEKIILDKCIELYNSSNNLTTSLRPRPLGYGLYTDMSLGFGALIFTWRNVPYNTPLVFWYKSNNWEPLFERKH